MRRVFWAAGQWLLLLSPRPVFGWRRLVLRAFGARVGLHVHVYPSTRIVMPWNVELDDWSDLGEDVYVYCLGRVHVGRSATVSYRSHLCAGAHDLNEPKMPLLSSTVLITLTPEHVRSAAGTLWQAPGDQTAETEGHRRDRVGNMSLHRCETRAGGSRRV
jgi:hypothetical protein